MTNIQTDEPVPIPWPTGKETGHEKQAHGNEPLCRCTVEPEIEANEQSKKYWYIIGIIWSIMLQYGHKKKVSK